MSANIHRRTLLRVGAAMVATGWEPGTRAGASSNATIASDEAPAPSFISLWPQGAPGMPTPPPVEVVVDRSNIPGIRDRAFSGILHPRLGVFRAERPNGAAVLLFPGGGYRHLAVDREGYDMARWLAARGFTAFVLFYRLPAEGWAAGPDVALSDAQRAIRIIRSRATEFAIVADRIAIMGFSAGGHLCADLAARHRKQTYEAMDAADLLPAAMYCAAPIYPVITMQPPFAHAGSRKLLIGPDADAATEAAHSPDRNIPDDPPPHFLVHAEDDAAVSVENTLLLRAALIARRGAVETHIFAHGGHGFGLRNSIGKPVEAWPDLWLAWARSIGLAG